MAIPMPTRQLFIDGEWREPILKKRIPIVNPATEEVIGKPLYHFFLLLSFSSCNRLDPRSSGKHFWFRWGSFDFGASLRTTNYHLHTESTPLFPLIFVEIDPCMCWI